MKIKICQNFQGIRKYKNLMNYKYIIYFLFIQILIERGGKK